MPDYKTMYLHLFNAVTDTIRQLETAQKEIAIPNIITRLETIQKETEEVYLSAKETL